MPQSLSLPSYSPSRHPIETWRHWYNQNKHIIEEQVRRQQSIRVNQSELRLLAPYEYLDSLNQRQVWEPYLTGRERQEFDSQLRAFMRQNRATMLRLRPAPLGSN